MSGRSPPRRAAFTLVGEEGAHPNRRFGEDVAIDGDVAVIAAPGFQLEGRICGAAYVFERQEDVWTQTQRLETPRTDMKGFGRLVGVSGDRIVVLGGTARSSNSQAFWSYVRGEGGRWVEEAEVEVGQVGWDAELRGTTAVVGRWGAVDVFEVAEGRWALRQSLEAPPGRHPARFGRWISLAGDTLAVASDDSSDDSGRSGTVPVYVYRRTDGRFEPDGTLWLAQSAEESKGCLALGGGALVVLEDMTARRVAIAERLASGWELSGFRTGLRDRRLRLTSPVAAAADGALAVLTTESEATTETLVQTKRDGTWLQVLVPTSELRLTSPARACAALSGRTALFGGDLWSSADGSGRAWFVEITDEDLASATPLVPEVRKDGPEERSLPVR